MSTERKPPHKVSIEELDGELIARGAQIPTDQLFDFEDKQGTPERDLIMCQVKKLYINAASIPENEAFKNVETWDLVRKIAEKARGIAGEPTKGIWGVDDRKDCYEIGEEKIKRNTGGTAAICLKDNIIDIGKGLAMPKVINYGKTFNLCDIEPFRLQAVVMGRMGTGYLVGEDLIVTAGHCASERNVTNLQFVFDFKMVGPRETATIPLDNIYSGVRIVDRVKSRKKYGIDWAVVQLDRKVKNRQPVTLSKNDISCGQSVYIIGHPCGLPMKYAPGAAVRRLETSYFSADLDVYSCNSGSPVFDSDTHEVIGMVVYGDSSDFRWTGRGWLSIVYPNPTTKSMGAECTRVSEFSNAALR
ncbi:MAG: trypsin-like peptidase domain-containing protein [Candidatus Aminicenantes bacterium]|nr:trypsin-like peptidase domain-containing protein [Candidatus Aminicenantes bacterium]